MVNINYYYIKLYIQDNNLPVRRQQPPSEMLNDYYRALFILSRMRITKLNTFNYLG